MIPRSETTVGILSACIIIISSSCLLVVQKEDSKSDNGSLRYAFLFYAFSSQVMAQ